MSEETPPSPTQQTVNLGLGDPNGWLSRLVQGGGATVLFVMAVWGFTIIKDELKTARLDMKESHKDSREAAKEAHKAFIEDADRTRVQMQKQWDEAREGRKMTLELQGDIRAHQKMMEASQAKNAELIVEVKKLAESNTAVNKALLDEVKKLNKSP